MKLTTLLLVLMFVSMTSAQSVNWEKIDMADAFGYTSTVDSQINVIVVASGPFETQATTIYVRKRIHYNKNSTKTTPIDISKLKTGVYLLQMENDQGNRISKKIIKK